MFIKKLFIVNFLLLPFNYSHSQNGWQSVFTEHMLSYSSVHFIDQNTGIACAGNNVVKSTNGGINWTRYNTGFASVITDIKMLNADNIISVCEGGLIIKSTNGGLNWYTVHPSSDLIYMHNLVFTDSLHGYAVAQTNLQTGHVFRTTNGGENWTVNNIANPVYVTFASNSSTGWIHGSYTTGHPFFEYYIAVYKTTNYGETWYSVFARQTVSINPGPVFFKDENTGYYVIQLATAYIAKTNSGGAVWANVHTSSGTQINSIFAKGEKAWFVGNSGKIIFTSNGGSSFSDQQSGVTSHLVSVFFIDENTGWIATTNGIILKSTSGGVTAVNNSNNFIPDKFSLSQNYPNPFNPTTKIKYSIPTTQYTILKVFNALGKEVATLVNEKQSQGSYEVEFNGNSLPSGIYFYRLWVSTPSGETEDFVETKRMILLK